MKRKEKPFDMNLMHLSDQELEEQKKREREQSIKSKKKRFEKIRYNPWMDRGRF